MGSYLKLLDSTVNFHVDEIPYFLDDIKKDLKKHYGDCFEAMAWHEKIEQATNITEILNEFQLDFDESGAIITTSEYIYCTDAIQVILCSLAGLAANHGEIIFKNVDYCKIYSYKYRDSNIVFSVFEM